MHSAKDTDYRNAVAKNLIQHRDDINGISSTLNDTAGVNGTSGVIETLGTHTSQVEDLYTKADNITGGIADSPYLFMFERKASNGSVYFSFWNGHVWSAFADIGGNAVAGTIHWTYGPGERVNVFCVGAATKHMYGKWLYIPNWTWHPIQLEWTDMGGDFS